MPLRMMVTVTLDPLGPRIIRTASRRSLASWPSTLMMRSPASMPALCAGVSSIGEMTVTNPSRMVMWIPMPVNLPLVSICRSS